MNLEFGISLSVVNLFKMFNLIPLNQQHKRSVSTTVAK